MRVDGQVRSEDETCVMVISNLFSIISLIALAGRWMISPAAMRLTTASSSRLILGGDPGGTSAVGAGSSAAVAASSVAVTAAPALFGCVSHVCRDKSVCKWWSQSEVMAKCRVWVCDEWECPGRHSPFTPVRVERWIAGAVEPMRGKVDGCSREGGRDRVGQ